MTAINRARIPRNAPRGRVYSNPGAPVQNPQMYSGALPGYVYPSYLGSYWNQFLASTGKLPSVVILNSGNGDVPWNSDYEGLCTSLHNLGGITVLGYTYSNYGTRPAATVEAAIGNYLGAGITPGANGVDGIFIDEFQYTSGGYSYYSGICASIKSQFIAGGGSHNPPIWGNPGVYLDSSYLALPVTAFITFEGPLLTYIDGAYNVSIAGTPSSGRGLYPRSRFAHLVYQVARDQVDGTVDLAYANNAGWATTNPLGGNDPYAFIPGNDYLNDMVTRTLAQPEANPAGIPPVVYPLQEPVYSRTPLPRRGRAGSGNRGGPVRNPTPGPRVYPLHGPVRYRIIPPPRGRAGGNRGGPVIPFIAPRFRLDSPCSGWATGNPATQWET